MVPDRAGADTRVDVTIPLSDLLGIDGASVIEDTWLRARAGQHGYLSGKDAKVIACDALPVPVVTGSPDWAVIGQMITLAADAYAHGGFGGRAGEAHRGQPRQGASARPNRHLHPPRRLGLRAPARRIHPRHQPRQTHRAAQPRTTTRNPTQRVDPDPGNAQPSGQRTTPAGLTRGLGLSRGDVH
jgi:hypothetical protein